MTPSQEAIAKKCLDAAYDNSMDFPSILKALHEAGFEGYDVDFRQGTATYFLSTGGHVRLVLSHAIEGAVAQEFRAQIVESAVREAQSKAPGYTYAGFCAKVTAAGCAGYMVSIVGRRVVYFGRTAETHVEHFPS